MEHLGTTRKRIFDAVEQSGIPTHEFNYNAEGKQIVLTHTSSEHFLKLVRGERFDLYSIDLTSFTPGKNVKRFKIRNGTNVQTEVNIDKCIEQLNLWLRDVVGRWRVEASMPNPFEELKTAYQDIDSTDDESPLSDSQREKFIEELKELPEYLSKTFQIPSGDSERFKREIRDEVLKGVEELLSKNQKRSIIRNFFFGAIGKVVGSWVTNIPTETIMVKVVEYFQKITGILPPHQP